RQAQYRPPDGALALRQHAEGHLHLQHRPVREERDAAAALPVQRVGGQVVAARAASRGAGCGAIEACGRACRRACGRRAMKAETIRLHSGRAWKVFTGGSGPDLVWLHGLRGVDPTDPMLSSLQQSYRVTAPVAPGFTELEELDHIDNIHELALDYDD